MIGDLRCNTCQYSWEAEIPNSGSLVGVRCPKCGAASGTKESFWPTFVTVGNGTYANKTTEFVNFVSGEGIILGKFCSLGAGVVIMTGGEHNYNQVTTSPLDKLRCMTDPLARNRNYVPTGHTTLENDVWVGNHAMIGGGAKIGSGCVIGARAVVFKDIEPYSIVVGNPGRVIKRRFDDRTIQRLLRLNWWDWTTDFIYENLDWFYKPVPEFLTHFGV